jgi:lipopolysaccharide transport protein LptA
VEIKADKLVIFDKDHEARYTGHVRVRSGTTTITCDRLLAQYTQAQEFTHIFCDDNVEAVDGDKRVKGDHGDFDNETGVVVITATPWVEIWNGKTHLWGKKATFTTGESKLEVDQPTTVIDEAGLGRDAGTPRRARDGGR